VRKDSILVGLAVLAVSGIANASERAEDVPTFSKDIAPIFYKSCVSCHRENHIAPMSLMTYEDSRPWARAIKQKVEAREMPPWGAAHGIQQYANDQSLPSETIATISAWVDGGAPRGNPSDLPDAPQFTDGWSIGEPDLVFTMVEPYHVPPDGTIPYLYITVPTNLTEDIWISATEYRPGDKRVVHHVIPDVKQGNGYPIDPSPKLERDRSKKSIPGATVGGFVPNRLGLKFPDGVASRIPAGAEVEAQMHYTSIGIPVTDQSSWGVVLTKEPLENLRKTGGGQVADLRFSIPPHDGNHEVRAVRRIKTDTLLANMMPHMHVRGKDAKYTLRYPDGREEVVLWVPNYDFNWQLRYELVEPILMPAGSELEVVMHFDNSANNKYNPDPNAEVRFGEQTWEEMMIGFYGTVDVEAAEKKATNNK